MTYHVELVVNFLSYDGLYPGGIYAFGKTGLLPLHAHLRPLQGSSPSQPVTVASPIRHRDLAMPVIEGAWPPARVHQ